MDTQAWFKRIPLYRLIRNNGLGILPPVPTYFLFLLSSDVKVFFLLLIQIAKVGLPLARELNPPRGIPPLH
jgi:hypothetical protein